LQKPDGFYSVLALTVEIDLGASPANIAKRRLNCTSFSRFFCQRSTKIQKFRKFKGKKWLLSYHFQKN
jgi:hypothetical protein